MIRDNSETIVSPEQAREFLGEPGRVFVDARFALGDTEAGRRAYRENHIPGAVYAHLDEDLSSPVTAATGRHPLPEIPALAARLGAWGIDGASRVIVYDDSGGAMAAARLWWLLRWLGHRHAAVLDGGLPAWLEVGGPVDAEPVTPTPKQFSPVPNHDLLVEAADLAPGPEASGWTLIDTRPGERFSGETEPLDTVAGHVPGAISIPFAEHVGAGGRFKPADELKALFESRLGAGTTRRLACMCGSGVTACHGLLALEIAGIRHARLYAGSWSEWIRNPSRPVVLGP